MPKQFYTERDVEDLVNRGVMVLELCDDVVLTDLAYEKAKRLGLKLQREKEKPPAAPVRPYIAKPVQKPESRPTGSIPVSKNAEDIKVRVKNAVIARLGSKIDPVLLDSIIERVLVNVGVK